MDHDPPMGHSFGCLSVGLRLHSVKPSWRNPVGEEATPPGSPSQSKSISNTISGSLAGTIKLASLKSPCETFSMEVLYDAREVLFYCVQCMDA